MHPGNLLVLQVLCTCALYSGIHRRGILSDLSSPPISAFMKEGVVCSLGAESQLCNWQKKSQGMPAGPIVTLLNGHLETSCAGI
jgi:hypothetical protein